MGQVHRRQLGRGRHAIGLAPVPARSALPAARVFKATAFLLGAGAHAGGLHIALKLSDRHFGALDLQAREAFQHHPLADLRPGRARGQSPKRHHH